MSIDLKIFQTIYKTEKKLTEKYIGHVDFTWQYAAIKYTADCTIGIPFDLFDKTIVELLLIDEVLSIEEIGNILGFNLVDNPQKQQYKDNAEYDILKIALDNLYNYQMIEIGDIYYSACRLTNIGKEYAKKGRKFKTELNKPFILYYDHTSQRHKEAKFIFQDFELNGNNISIDSGFNYLDETLMKEIASVQDTEVYNEKNETSFTNPSILLDQSFLFSLNIKVVILYDIENQNFRLLAYEPTTQKIYDFFSEWLNYNKINEIKNHWLSQNQAKTSLKIPQKYCNEIIQISQSFKEALENHSNNFLEISKQAYHLDYVEIAYFWNNLSAFINDKSKEFCFFLYQPHEKYMDLIKKLVSTYPQITFYVIFNIKNIPNQLFDEYINFTNINFDFDKNLFAIVAEFNEISNFKFWTVEEKIYEYNQQAVLVNEGYYFQALVRNEPDISEYFSMKKCIANKIIHEIQEAFFKEIEKIKIEIENNEINVSKSLIAKYEQMLTKVMVFIDLQEDERILQIIYQIEQTHNEFLTYIKNIHQELLLTNLNKLSDRFKEEKISKLEQMQKYSKELQIFKTELHDDYKLIHEKIQALEMEFSSEEQRIKDEILAKTYIIDTNIFIKDPYIISKIDEKHYIVLSHTVIEELDKLKKRPEIKDKASDAISNLNKIIIKNKKIKTQKAQTELLGEDYSQKSPDNRILSVAYLNKDKNPILLTDDQGLQLKAKAFDIPTISLEDLLKNMKNNARNIDEEINYRNIFLQMQPSKDGNYHLSNYINLLKQNYPDFDYKKLGFNKSYEFIQSLNIFLVLEQKFIKLKS